MDDRAPAASAPLGTSASASSFSSWKLAVGAAFGAVGLATGAAYYFYGGTPKAGGEAPAALPNNGRSIAERGEEREPQTLQEMVERLKKQSYITTPEAERAMLTVDRAKYVADVGEDEPQNSNPYADAACPIGFYATISAPHMAALSLDLLAPKIKPGANVLDVGSGSGFTAACFAVMVGEEGQVHGIEHIPELVEQSIDNIRSANPDLLSRINIIEGDGLMGVPQHAPYDVINVAAAAEEVPQALIDQLKPGGRMVIPVGPSAEFQTYYQIDVSEDGRDVKTLPLMQVRFVPMLSKDVQLTGEFSNNARILNAQDGSRMLVMPVLHHAPDSTSEQLKLVRSQLDAWAKEAREERGDERARQKEREEQNDDERKAEAKKYTMEEVSKHNKRNDCWMVIYGKVYDFTRFIDEHPGGDIVLEGAGTEATELFEDVAHSQDAKEMLKEFYVGEFME
ncbi:Protein-L-isoaspartate(D-aspartate) O-methyltransferase [Balamuthia mandrillaris]